MNALKSASGHPVTHLAFAPDGSAFAAAQPHSGVTLHDRATGQPIRTAGKNNVAAYRGLVFFHDGTRLAASGPKGLELFDVPDMTCFLHHRYARWALLATDGVDLVAAWHTRVERIIHPPRGRADLPGAVPVWPHSSVLIEGLSPDGRFVAWVEREKRLAVGDLTATRLHPVNHLTLAEADAPGLKPWAPPSAQYPDRIVFAPRSDRFAVRTGKAVLVFDMPSWEVEPEESATEVPRPHSVLHSVFEVDAPPKWPKGEWYPPVAFTPCGRFLFVRRPHHQVQMWEVASGSMLTQWNWQLDAVASLAIAPDGMTAAAGGRFGKVVVWDLE